MNVRAHMKELLIPAAILFAGIVLAITTYILHARHTITHGTENPGAASPISPTDHIIGKPDAPVVIIEYADIDSRYSKSFQLTMEQLMTEYGTKGSVAWVFRHFPLADFHINAVTHAIAAECAAALGGEQDFWRFIDTVQSNAPGDNEFNPKDYPVIVRALGIDETQFQRCLSSGTYEPRVHDNFVNAQAAGATGSPYLIILRKGQDPLPIQGTVPYAALKKIIDDAVASAK